MRRLKLQRICPTAEQVRTKWKSLKRNSFSVVQVQRRLTRELLACGVTPDDPVESSQRREYPGVSCMSRHRYCGSKAGRHKARLGSPLIVALQKVRHHFPTLQRGFELGSQPLLQDCMTLLTRMDSRLKRLEGGGFSLEPRGGDGGEWLQSGSKTPAVGRRGGVLEPALDELLQIVTSEEETADTPQNPPTSEPSEVVVVGVCCSRELKLHTLNWLSTESFSCNYMLYSFHPFPNVIGSFVQLFLCDEFS
uniref:Uncharacterized protein n=1 Tax=Sphaerodactylus townsendi TaxID=933632 RepID=A0ACB8FGH8_9SAUR